MDISIPMQGEFDLKASLSLPSGASSLVIFSHGSGSSRHSPRNNYVAELLNRENIATLLSDLLTEEEDSLYENRFNIDLLTERLIAVTAFAAQDPYLKNLPIAYFGASTGAASALQAAAIRGDLVKAVVSRGGRPDLAKGLREVVTPTLLLVGSLDEAVIGMNRQAYAELRCEKKLEIVSGASHLFEEPGKLDEVAALSIDWFRKHLIPAGRQRPYGLGERPAA